MLTHTKIISKEKYIVTLKPLHLLLKLPGARIGGSGEGNLHFDKGVLRNDTIASLAGREVRAVRLINHSHHFEACIAAGLWVWLREEWVDVIREEIDWDAVPMDALLVFRDGTRRHFAGLLDRSTVKFWKHGCSSGTAGDWDTVNEADIAKVEPWR